METIIGQSPDSVFAAARRHQMALEIALRVQDVWLVARAAEGLKRALNTAQLTRGITQMTLASVVGPMYELLGKVPSWASADAERLERWELARHEWCGSLDGPDLFELDARGANLEGAEFLGLHVVDSGLIAPLGRARFINALIDNCDFTYADLRNTIWARSYVRCSFLRESCLADATLEQTTFVACDLRGADLSASGDREGKTTGEVWFIKCDLRDADFTGRNLDRLTAYDCKLHGVKGIDRACPLKVRRADVSPLANGSQVVGLDAAGIYASDPTPATVATRGALTDSSNGGER